MSSKQIEVNIAGQAYKFAVSADNEAALREAAAMVDNQMTRIKNGSSTKGIERVAVMAAISIASDLLSMQRQAASDSALPIDTIRAKLADLNARTDEALRQYGEVIPLDPFDRAGRRPRAFVVAEMRRRGPEALRRTASSR